MSFSCVACEARMHAEDAHETCMLCLGLDHARQAVEDPFSCMSCQLMTERVLRARWERMKAVSRPEAHRRLPPSGTVRRHGDPPASMGAPPAKRSDLDLLESRTAALRSDLEAIREEDSISIHADSDLDSASGLYLPPSEGARSAAPSAAVSAAPTRAVSTGSGPLQATAETRELLERVAVSLGLQWEKPETDVLQIPTCPEFAAAFREYWGQARGRLRYSRETKPWASMAGSKSLGIADYPVMDDMVAAMVLPDREIIGRIPRLAAGPSRISDDLLCNTYRVLAAMGRMMNASMLLGSYLSRLIPALSGDDRTLADEAQEVSRLLHLLQAELARGNGLAVASVVSSRRHLWLSQTKLPPPIQKAFMDLPFTPEVAFGPGVEAILEQTVKLRKDRETLQQFMGATRPRPGPRQPTSSSIPQPPSGPSRWNQPSGGQQANQGRGRGRQRNRPQRKGPPRGGGQPAAAAPNPPRRRPT